MTRASSAKRHRQKKIQLMVRKYGPIFVILCLLVVAVIVIQSRGKQDLEDTETQEAQVREPVTEVTEEPEPVITYSAQTTENTVTVGDSIVSQHAIMIDLTTHEIVLEKGHTEQINPASMTKVLTVLVAAEHIEDLSQLDDTLAMTPEITDYAYINECSTAGFMKDEVVTVRDMFYGTILPSGGDAAVGLATYIAGSQDAFVELMNEKVEELGLSETTHFTNCVGVYDENLYCSVYDMAMILEAAMDNELARQILTAPNYTTSITEQHPEGIVLFNRFVSRMGRKETLGTITAGKTGYVQAAGCCAASYGEDANGNPYICVTAGSSTTWQCVYDQVYLYDQVFQ